MTEEEIKKLKHDCWVAQTMLATLLATTGPVLLDKETAARNFDNYGIEIEEAEGDKLLILLKEKNDTENN